MLRARRSKKNTTSAHPRRQEWNNCAHKSIQCQSSLSSQLRLEYFQIQLRQRPLGVIQRDVCYQLHHDVILGFLLVRVAVAAVNRNEFDGPDEWLFRGTYFKCRVEYGGEGFRLQVEREAAHSLDTMTGNAELVKVEIKET